jgi:hypothetical protein
LQYFEYRNIGRKRYRNREGEINKRERSKIMKNRSCEKGTPTSLVRLGSRLGVTPTACLVSLLIYPYMGQAVEAYFLEKNYDVNTYF